MVRTRYQQLILDVAQDVLGESNIDVQFVTDKSSSSSSARPKTIDSRLLKKDESVLTALYSEFQGLREEQRKTNDLLEQILSRLKSYD